MTPSPTSWAGWKVTACPISSPRTPVTEGGDAPGDLVAEDHRVPEHSRARPCRAPVREVGAADAAPLHRDDHLARARDGVGDLVDAQVSGAVDDDGPHAASSSRTRSRPWTSGETIAEISVMPEYATSIAAMGHQTLSRR